MSSLFLLSSASRTALRIVASVATSGALLGAVACSSDPAVTPPGETDAGGSSGSSGSSGTSGTSGGFEAGPRPTCPPYTPRAGKATATNEFGTLVDIPEIACRTLRSRDGAVVGYAASFGRFQASFRTTSLSSQMEAIDRVSLTAYGPYAGDGVLASTSLTYTIRNQAGQYTTGTSGTLTLSEGGKKGVLAGLAGASFEFQCDPSDDTAPTAGPALTDAPGRAIIERERGGDATVIDGIKCRESAPSATLPNLQITFPYDTFDIKDGPCVPSQVRIEAKVDGPGTYDVGLGSYVVWNLQDVAFVGTSVNGKTAVTLTGVRPARGTFAGTTPSGAGGNNFNGSFTCPTP